MKKYLTISTVTLLLLPTVLFGQNGYFDNNPIWRMGSQCAISTCIGSGVCVDVRDYNYYLKGDTTINSHLYKKLFIKGSGSFSWNGGNPPPCCQGSYVFNDTLNPVAFLRDTLNKIYIVDALGNPDMLLYDFNLSVGDTLPLTYNNHDSTITVIANDSVPISNFYRRRFELSGNTWSQFLVEGIGHDRGLLEPMQLPLECGWNLTCYGLGDTAYYPSLGATCNNGVGIEETEYFNSQINVYPNPIRDELHVDALQYQPMEIVLCDITLRKILQQKFTNSVSLNTAQLAKGIYIYEVRNKNGVIKKGKVVKE